MMVRFESDASSSVSMFEEDAALMLRMMNHSGTIPSAIRAENVAVALNNLENAVEEESERETGVEMVITEDPVEVIKKEDMPEEIVSIHTRAYPLIQLLKAASDKKEGIMWDYD